jgi:EAL domain-containing protein (putative c-di-GMP-specific phosphodiesterase class I)
MDRLLEDPRALSAVFHPVLHSHAPSARPEYLEALIRGPQDTALCSPDILFEYARRKRRALELDRACVRTVLTAACALPEDLRIGLNLHASTLALDPEFLTFLGDLTSRLGIDPARLVVEVVEHVLPRDEATFATALAGLRAIGAAIALDDVGQGHSNYRMALDCRPSYLKLDRYFVTGAHADHHRQAVLASVVTLARPFGARVVAEGIETEDDLAAVRAAGIDLVQGFLFGPPAPAASHIASLERSRP